MTKINQKTRNPAILATENLRLLPKNEKNFAVEGEKGSKVLHGQSKTVRTKGSKTYPIVEAKNVLQSWYDLRLNEITYQVEGRLKKESDYKVLNENSVFVKLLSAGYNISLGTLCALLNSDFIEAYNPIKEYFTNLRPWDGKTDYISILANHVQAVDQNQFNHHFQKMMVRTIACALDDHVFNKHAFIMVGAAQGTGKSSFCRYLCPPVLNDYFTENISNDKDGQIALVQNFMINLDELSTMTKFEINYLKSLFSKDRVKVRHPYARKSQTDTRRCSFVGSTNEDMFLSDSTGSVRWLCFEITGINKEDPTQGKNYRNVPIDFVWSQAYSLYKSGFKYQLTADEIRDNEIRNQQYQKITNEFEAVQTWLQPGNDCDEFKNTSEILILLNEKTQHQFKFSTDKIGKALNALGFVRTSKRKAVELSDKKQPRWGYYVQY